ncbi:MAG TPA: GTPase, partial [Dehalococcoidia bacterium]|nr:GTPase [Dehalococcoidia bacterium]
MKPIIAIVGRTNVGKSTLFNRLTGRQVAIIEDLPGTTRDRIFADALLLDQEVTLVDTGGLGLLGDSGIESKVKRQVGTAIEEADVIVFMLDARDGLIGPDHEIADMLRKSDKPLLLVANKVDNPKLENALADFFQLGLG